ncbi:hypothetical protein C2869_06225 [Saccharobesus litoralis]|uniref:Right handed beta helix domain-containing protein n=1 Tax=Saccharobesus litoralis TaxID=2172099 RepID=A0A2S0VPD4_9ALTE|nr:right-handed parallel beta-helix repeat-containing protein [Saccharobesus litoralis]AWB66059.1 hypothetical protein C2869_06225 [Saccharobesus litoralis]
MMSQCKIKLLLIILSASVLLSCANTHPNNQAAVAHNNKSRVDSIGSDSQCHALPFDPKGNVNSLQQALQNATNTGLPVKISGQYYIDNEIKVILRNDLIVDASQALFFATSKLDGDLFSLDAHSKHSQKCALQVESEVHWVGGFINIANAKVSQVVPITKMTPQGRTGTKKTADALSIRGHHNGFQKLRNVIVDGITVVGTKTAKDPFYLAGGDSGILMAGTRQATIKNNNFFGIRDAAIYVTAAGKNGEIGDDFVLINNYVERAYDGITSKRGADRITMQNNRLNNVAVGLSIKHLFSGRTSYQANISNNTIKSAVRAISLERVNDATVANNVISGLGDIYAGKTSPINARGRHYEAIGLDGAQGNLVIKNNTIQGVNGKRTIKFKTYGIVSRSYNKRPTTDYLAINNLFHDLDSDIQQFK